MISKKRDHTGLSLYIFLSRQSKFLKFYFEIEVEKIRFKILTFKRRYCDASSLTIYPSRHAIDFCVRNITIITEKWFFHESHSSVICSYKNIRINKCSGSYRENGEYLGNVWSFIQTKESLLLQVTFYQK